MKIKNKILLIVINLGLGGAERSNLTLARLLNQNGYHVTVFSLFKADFYHNSDINIIYGTTSKNKLAILRAVAKLIYISTQYNVLIAGLEYGASIFTYITSIINRKPKIAIVHANIAKFTHASAKGLKRTIYKFILPKFNDIICVSNESKQSLPSFTNSRNISHKITVIYNVYLPESYKRHPIKNEHLTLFDNTCIKIVSAGRLYNPVKGFDQLIRAFAEINQISPNTYRLYILGDGPDMNHLLHLIKELKLTNLVFLLGAVDNILDYFEKTDIFISSSINEGMPMVILEALSENNVIITTDTGAREIINNGEFGIITPINDSHAMAKAIMNLCENHIQYEMLQQSSKICLSKFGTPEYIKKWQLILNKYIYL